MEAGQNREKYCAGYLNYRPGESLGRKHESPILPEAQV
jgi:hypothetical protein